MFKDTKEELARLEAALLDGEAPTQRIPAVPETEEPVEQPENLDEIDSIIAEFLDGDRPADHPGDYENYANGYGGKIYNGDKVDVDPEEISWALLERDTQPKLTGLWILLFSLLGANLLVMAYWVLRFLGVF